jgi:hypothetical protein
LSFGAIKGLPLVVKNVKPIKIARSRLTNQFGPNKCLIPQTQPKVGTADAPVLRESNSGPRKEPGSFDLTDCCINQLAKFLPLLIGN